MKLNNGEVKIMPAGPRRRPAAIGVAAGTGAGTVDCSPLPSLTVMVMIMPLHVNYHLTIY